MSRHNITPRDHEIIIIKTISVSSNIWNLILSRNVKSARLQIIAIYNIIITLAKFTLLIDAISIKELDAKNPIVLQR